MNVLMIALFTIAENGPLNGEGSSQACDMKVFDRANIERYRSLSICFG